MVHRLRRAESLLVLVKHDARDAPLQDLELMIMIMHAITETVIMYVGTNIVSKLTSDPKCSSKTESRKGVLIYSRLAHG